MSKILTVSNKFFSLRGQIGIVDSSSKELLYVAKGKLFSFTSPWRIYNSQDVEVSKVRKLIFSFTKGWIISGKLGDFTIKKKFWSWNRTYLVNGGKYNGATIKGSFTDIRLEVTHNSKWIISTEEHLFSMNQAHSLTVFEDNVDDENFAAILMVILMTDKKEEKEEDDYYYDD